ncbi:MAG: hypothetical protein JKX68_08115 [Flavobacteriales bacterium]|nr:hypothetical protein [Flavobacteriales bacterium]
METIENITIQQYFSLEDATSYDIFLDVMNPENLFCGKKCNVSSLTFDEIQVTRKILSNPNTEDIKDLYLMLFGVRGDMDNSPDELFLNESVFQLFKATNFIKDFIGKINKKEAEWLSGDKSDVLEMLNASNRLAPFNHLLQKTDLAQMFGTTPDEIGSWKYSKVFIILASQKVRNEIQKEFNEIK